MQRSKRIWWARLKTNKPLHAQVFAAAMGKSFSELDKVFHLHEEHTTKSIQVARAFALAHGAVCLLFRKKTKLPLSRAEVALAGARERPTPFKELKRSKTRAKGKGPKHSRPQRRDPLAQELHVLNVFVPLLGPVPLGLRPLNLRPSLVEVAPLPWAVKDWLRHAWEGTAVKEWAKRPCQGRSLDPLPRKNLLRNALEATVRKELVKPRIRGRMAQQ